MSFPINLVGELIAVRIEVPQGPVLLPDWKRNLSGTVIAHGPGCSKDVVLSSRVAFGAAVGMDARSGSEDIRILKERDIDFVYEDTPICEECKKNYVESSEDFCTDCLDSNPSLSIHW